MWGFQIAPVARGLVWVRLVPVLTGWVLPIVLFLPIAAHAATMSGPYEVKSVLISGQGAHIEVAPNPANCTSNWAGTQFLLQRTQAHYQDGLSAILTAHTANRPIIFWWDPMGSGDCSFLNQLKIDALQVKK